MKSTTSDVESIYAKIGRFAVEFEQTCHTMENGVRYILLGEGLVNENIQEVLLAGLTAEPLSTLLHSLCHEHLKPTPAEGKIIDFIFTNFKNLNSKRNDLLHGKWFFGETTTDYGEMSVVGFGVKLHKKKTGTSTKRFEYSESDFDELYTSARQCHGLMSKLTNCVAGSYPLEKNFFVKDGIYIELNGFCIK